MVTIKKIRAREILDSRGHPTLEIDIILHNGIQGRASVPSGASTGSCEAVEKRDGDFQRYHGKGVQKLANMINEQLAPKLIGSSVIDQQAFDGFLINLDNSANKATFGANTTLALSLAAAKAAAQQNHVPLYQYLAQLAPGTTQFTLPVPMINIINGGAHANNQLALQEFLILPIAAANFVEAVRYGATIFQELKQLLHTRKLSTSVGDEGGFAPDLLNADVVLDYIMMAIERAGLIPGQDVYLGLDVAGNELYHEGYYIIGQEKLTQQELVNYLGDLVGKYPLISIEDGMAEQDWTGWRKLTAALGQKIQLVGDDLFVTHVSLLQQGITQNSANAILIKPNQVGTLTETLAAIYLAKSAHYNTIISHRSGETEDTTIADLAVATDAGQIKTGSMCRSERVAKYNQLLRINEDLGVGAHYAGASVFKRFSNFS